MRYIKELSQETLKMLKRIYQYSKHDRVRQRAHCIQLSYKRYQISELMNIFEVSRNTIYNWLNNWESKRLAGLYERPGRGRKRLLNSEEEITVKEWVKETPKSLTTVRDKVKTNLDIIVSKDTIKRIIKRAKMTWKRIKKVVSDSPMPEIYEKKIKELEALKERERLGEIEIRYVDETGFCLTPYIPYCWQEHKETITVKSQRSKRLNVLGFLTKDNLLEAYTFYCSINSDVMIACIDDFCEKITKNTVLVMDNSSVHQNNLLWDKEEEWSKKGLDIFFLPTYSPQLNIIEILWRFIKYKWLPIDAYESLSHLEEAVENIIINFGQGEYTINFA